MTLYSLSRVTKVYGQRKVLDIEALDIQSGMIYALLGPNGSGKTTLLNILGFLEAPTSGQVRFQKEVVAFAESSLQSLRKRVVVVSQHPVVFTTTVYKNLEFGLKIRRIDRRQRGRIIEEALELVGMRAWAKARADKLSGGEMQRVVLARALALSPDVLLCDEPMANVDTENQAAVVNILRRINQQQKISLVVSTHDRLQAAALAQNTICLDGGRRADAVDENVFSAEITRTEAGSCIGVIQGAVELRLPPGQKGKVRLAIDAEKVRLLKEAEGQKNLVRGRVVQIAGDNGCVRVIVDARIGLTVLMPDDRYRDVRPMVGDMVCIEIPTDAVRLL